LCVSGCGQNETVGHLIIHCPTFGFLWQLVKSWLGVYSVDPQHVMDHFHQFIYAAGGHISRCSLLHMTWLCCIWVLWNERNHRLFSNKVTSTVQLIEKVKITTLSWLKSKNVWFPYGYHMWWQQPLFVWGLADRCFSLFWFLRIGWCNFVLLLNALLVLGSRIFCLYISFWHVQKKKSMN